MDQKALSLFQEGCARGEPFGRELGLRTLRGDGVAKDLGKGFALLDGACRSNEDPYACARTALLLERGQGAPRNLVRAKALYRDACARGIRQWACEPLRHLP